jgi:hypothetical protein
VVPLSIQPGLHRSHILNNNRTTHSNTFLLLFHNMAVKAPHLLWGTQHFTSVPHTIHTLITWLLHLPPDLHRPALDPTLGHSLTLSLIPSSKHTHKHNNSRLLYRVVMAHRLSNLHPIIQKNPCALSNDFLNRFESLLHNRHLLWSTEPRW